MIQLIKNNTQEMLDEITKIRRHFHINPELSHKEVETSRYIERYLNNLGSFKVERIGSTGLIATIRGPKLGRSIALRCDMDALPLQELAAHTYASKNKGIMHACGHDAHMAIMLGVAKNLVKFKENIKGTIKLIFQPAEEVGGGAEEMINSNNLKEQKINAIMALHVDPTSPTGTIKTKKGLICAGVDSFAISFLGKAAHGSTPLAGCDAIASATTFIRDLYFQFNKSLGKSSVISIGTIEGGSSPNIIADNVLIKGTFRTTNEDARADALKIINKVMKETTKKTKVKTTLKLNSPYPPVINDDKLTDSIMEFAKDNLGKKSVVKMKQHVMLAEDFAFYRSLAPICLYFLGTQENPKEPLALHTPNFDINEESLFYGVYLQSLWALDIKVYF